MSISTEGIGNLPPPSQPQTEEERAEERAQRAEMAYLTENSALLTLKMWLNHVAYLSYGASPESIESLKILCKNIPTWNKPSPDLNALFTKAKEFNGKYDPDLPDLALKAFQSLP